MAFRERMRRYNEVMVGPDLTNEEHLHTCMRLFAEYILAMYSKDLVEGEHCEVDVPEDFNGRSVDLPAHGVRMYFPVRGATVFVEQLKD